VQGLLIDDAVASARRELPEEEAIGILIKKKAAKKKRTAPDVKEKHRIFQSLMGRGFPPGLILNKLGEREEDIDG
jgi:SOS response regulatory protein OraA/RecX